MKNVFKVAFMSVLLLFAVKVNAEPANDSFIDDNLYKCVIDSYNIGKEEYKNYNYNISIEELITITKLDCKVYSGLIENLSGLNKLTGLKSLNISGNTFLGGNLNLKIGGTGKLKSNIVLPPGLSLTDITYSYSVDGIVKVENGVVTALKGGTTYVTMTAKVTGNEIKEKYLVSVAGKQTTHPPTTSVKKSNNAYLKSLSVSNAEIDFKKSTFVYSLFVPKNISEVTIKASLEDSKASFVSGYAPRKVTLKQGANTVYIKIKAEDGTIKTYTLGITRSNGEDTNNLLSNIELSSGEIDFKPEVTIYTISVSNDVKELKVNAKATSLLAKVEVSDTLLKVGENKITITVTPESGDKKVYQLIVNREEFDSKDNYLKSLSIDGYDIDFKKDVFNYELSIKKESSLKINAVKEVVNSSVSIIGNKELVNGSKVIIRVTDVDGNIRDYTINITKSVLFDLSYKMIILFAEFIIILILLLVIIFRPKNKGVKRNNRNINRHGGNGRKINFVNNKVCRKCGAINDPLAIVCYLCGTELK